MVRIECPWCESEVAIETGELPAELTCPDCLSACEVAEDVAVAWPIAA